MSAVERFKRWRASRGLSQAEAAEALGISQALVSQIERGDASVTKVDLATKIEDLTADWPEGQITVREWVREGHPPSLTDASTVEESAA